MKVLITGISGSGKTSVIEELSRRGYAAFNTDDLPDVTRLEYAASGEQVDWPEGATDFSIYGWNWQEGGLKKLLASSETVFVGALASNQPKFYPLFDKVFVLMLCEATMISRLQSRDSNNNDFGKHPEDLAMLVNIRKRVEDEQIGLGATPIDAEQPLQAVADDILSQLTS